MHLPTLSPTFRSINSPKKPRIKDFSSLFLETNHVSTLLFKPEIYDYITQNHQESSQSKVIEQILETNEMYNYLKNLTNTEDSLKSHILQMGHSDLSKLYDGIRTVTQD